ncbi:MAG: ABC transporter ATP-binding protein [Dehalococcoidia bacterium]|nr:ABC transporter ATP-binding protein [Dehalococcoidia bacterium]
MRLFVRILRFPWNHKRRLFAAYLFTTGATAAYVFLPELFGNTVDLVKDRIEAGGVADSTILGISLLILALGIVRGIFSFGQMYMGESLGQHVVYDLRNMFYDRVQRLGFSFHDSQHTGGLMSKAITDVEAIRMFVNLVVVRTPYFMVLFVVVVFLMMRIDWQLTLLSLALLPVAMTVASLIRMRMRNAWLEAQEKFAVLNTTLQENLTGARVVKAFASSDYEEEKFRVRNEAVADDMYKAMRLNAFNGSFVLFIFLLTLGIVLLFGGLGVIDGRITLGEFTKFVLYLQILAQPFRMAGTIVNNLARAMSAATRIFEVLDTKSVVQDRPNATDMGHARGDVRFEKVSFGYRRDALVLHDFNLDVPAGRVVALLGAPGSGKSTLASLIPRFYDVTKGSVTIDGTDVRDVTLESLRRNIGVVQQDVFLFTDTIAANIAYGRPDASMDEIVRAAKIAQLHEHVVGLPDGYETVLGERGVSLSGGQRQRLSIARAILLDPPILVLDDSTSSVDARTENEIRKAMASVMEGRTTFIIAHRLSTVHNADTIVVLEEGRIAERGNHTELVEHGGLYREIYDLQLRPQEEVLMEFDVPAEAAAGSKQS